MSLRLRYDSIRRRYVDDVIAETERASRHHVGDVDPTTAQRQVAVVLVAAAIALLGIVVAQSGPVPSGLAEATTPEFARLARWGVVNVAGYLLIPWLALRLIGLRLADVGLRRPPPGSWVPYAWLLALSIPFVLLAAGQPDFQAKYPFYGLAPGEGLWPWFVAWWAIYAAQFLGIEFFFRGFLVLGLAPRFGIGAVFVSVVPYVMIHFTKPPLEAAAALIGGTVLGFLALKTGSVWWGVAIHVAIALLMDVLAR